MTQKIDLKNLDKSDWLTYRFDEIARKISETVDPNTTDLEIYVGLEHLDAESIHIKRFGTPADVSGGKLKCYPGDLIFGKRRAYQRKAAIAQFEGICSAHAFVLRAIPEVIDPRLFPFFLHSDQFMHRAVDISVGGLSPTINWGQLKEQEFLLPPLAEQARLAELLWAMDKVTERGKSVEYRLTKFQDSLFKDNIYQDSKIIDDHFGKLTSKHSIKRLSALITELQYGISESLDDDGLVPILRMNNLQNGKLDLSDLKYYSPNKDELAKFILEKGDILFNRTNSFDLVGKVSLFNVDANFSFASYLIRIKTDPAKLDPRYLNFFLNSAIGLAKVRKYRTPGVSQSNINAQSLKKLFIPLPGITEQKELMDKLTSLEETVSKSKSNLNSSKTLLKSLINQIFSTSA